MERPDMKAEIREIDLTRIIRESCTPYEDLIEDKGMTLRVSLPESFKILGDPKLLKSALENLLENAVKYSPPGEEIRISAQKESANRIKKRPHPGATTKQTHCIPTTGVPATPTRAQPVVKDEAMSLLPHYEANKSLPAMRKDG